MNSRLGIACLSACALTALVVAGAGCSKKSGVTVPIPSPSPSGSPAPDTIYVQTSSAKVIHQYKGASADNGGTIAAESLPTGDNSNGDVVYDPVSDTLWYPEANSSNLNYVEMWNNASKVGSTTNPILINFPFGEGTAAFDGVHHLLFVASQQGPTVSVYANPETMTAGATPAATITMQIADANGSRPQEMIYDPGTDRLFASDTGTMVAVFDGWGTAALNAVTGHTNPTIPANRYLQGLFSPDGLAYVPASDILFVGEQRIPGDIVVVKSASTLNGSVSHAQMVTGFSKPGALAFDDNPAHNPTGLLFVYDTQPIYVIPNGITASGNFSQISGIHVIFDGSSQQNVGFGMALDKTH